MKYSIFHQIERKMGENREKNGRQWRDIWEVFLFLDEYQRKIKRKY
jgi:hypothetical protein